MEAQRPAAGRQHTLNMEALVVKFEPPVISCIPSLIELCGDRPHVGALHHGPTHNLDAETFEFVHADLVTCQSGELALLRGLLTQAQITGKLAIPVSQFEDALRAFALLRIRLHATQLGGQEPDEVSPAQAGYPLFAFWFTLLGNLQNIICSTMLG